MTDVTAPTVRKATIVRFYDAAQARKDLSTYHTDVNLDFLQQSGLFAYWACKLVQAERQHARIEYALDRAEARRYKEIKIASIGKDKITEPGIKAEIAADKELGQIRELLLEAREEMGMLKATVEALRQRKDMLIQLGNQSREEMKGGPQIMHGANRENRNDRLKTLAATNAHINVE